MGLIKPVFTHSYRGVVFVGGVDGDLGSLEEGAAVFVCNSVVFSRSGVVLVGGVGGDLGSREDCLPRFGGDGSSSGGSFSLMISPTIV